MTKKDSATGLPEVPEGYFWRVGTQESGHWFPYTIWLMRKVPRRFFSGTKDEYVDSQGFQDLSNQAIKLAAQKVMLNQKFLVMERELLGDYPPKSLEKK